MSDFTALSNAMADVVRKVGESVVQVSGRRRMPASGVVWSADGVIVTAHHVVRSDNVSVRLPEGNTVGASLIGRDPTTDLALLRVEAGGLSPAEWADATPAVGELVLALARPGQSIQATLGVVSAVGAAWRTGAGGQMDSYLQTDVLMYPGFSGGALVGGTGQLLGINSSALVRGASVSIPTATVKRVAQSLLAHGRVQRGYLGVSTQPVRLPDNLREEVGQETGLLIVQVETGSPAEKGGMVLGDTIIRLADEPVRSHDDLVALLSGDRVGQKTPVGVIRGGELRTVNVTIGEKE